VMARRKEKWDCDSRMAIVWPSHATTDRRGSQSIKLDSGSSSD